MSEKASVSEKGAVLLGKHVACDAFDESRPLRVITHAHADHMVGLQRSMKNCEKVLMTSATRDLIGALRGQLSLMGGCVETLEYDKMIQHEEERITFLKCDHILGAAQVLVEDAEGSRIVFTGDFRLDDTPVLDSDILVMEATYGSPRCRRAFPVDPRSTLVSMVEKGLKHGPVYVFGYHGKLQEIMQILHTAGVRVPAVVPEKVFHVSKVCERHGMRLGRFMLSEETEGRELLESNSSCLAFYHMGARNWIDRNAFRIYVSGWEFNTACRQTADNEYIIALSDHSDFDGLNEYVRRSKPKLVITDNYRVGHAETMAAEIRKRYGIAAFALPKR